MKYLTVIGLLLAVTAHNTAASSAKEDYYVSRSDFFNKMANNKAFSAFVASDLEGNILKKSNNFDLAPTSCDLKIIATEALGKNGCGGKMSLGGRTYECRISNDKPIEHIIYEQLDNNGNLVRNGKTFLCSKITEAVMCAIFTTNDRYGMNLAKDNLVYEGLALKKMYEY